MVTKLLLCDTSQPLEISKFILHVDIMLDFTATISSQTKGAFELTSTVILKLKAKTTNHKG